MSLFGWPTGGNVPELSPKAKEERAKQKRVLLIMEAMQDAPIRFNLRGWAALSETGVQREYAKAIEPLLVRAAKEGEALWAVDSQ